MKLQYSRAFLGIVFVALLFINFDSPLFSQESDLFYFKNGETHGSPIQTMPESDVELLIVAGGLAAQAGQLAGTGLVRKSGGGSLIFSADDSISFAGGRIELAEGEIRISTAAQLGAPLSALQFAGPAGAVMHIRHAIEECAILTSPGRFAAVRAAMIEDSAGVASLRMTGAVEFSSGSTIDRLHVTAYSNGALALDPGASYTMTNGNNALSDSGNGGALYVENFAVLTLVAPTIYGRAPGYFFSNNKCGVNGGAIFNSGYLAISNAVFTENSSGANGGAIHNDVYGNLAIQNSVFENNASAAGGALRNDGIASVIDSVFRGNSTTSSAGSVLNAGAIAKLDMHAVRFEGNKSTGNGGAVMNNSAMVTFGDALFISNTGAAGGAVASTGVMTVRDSVFFGNHATAGGGAIFGNAGSRTQLVDVSFLSNKAALAATVGAGGGGAMRSVGALSISVSEGRTSLYSGNLAGPAANSIQIENSSNSFRRTLDIETNTSSAVLDMRDPLAGKFNVVSSENEISVTKTGAGIWKLGGMNDFTLGAADDSSKKTTLLIQEGALHLYRDGEVANASPDDAGAMVAPGKIRTSGSGSLFMLGVAGNPNGINTRMQVALVSGGGNAIDMGASPGSIIRFNAGATLGFDLAHASDAAAYIGLVLTGGTLVPDQGSLDLRTLGSVSGTFTLVDAAGMASGRFVSGNYSNFMLGGETVQEIIEAGNSRVADAGLRVWMAGDGKKLLLTQTNAAPSQQLTWTGSNGNLWQMATEQKNWENSSQESMHFVVGDCVEFDGNDTSGSADGKRIIQIGEKGVRAVDLKVSATAAESNYVMRGGSMEVTGKLHKSGSGSLTFENGANVFAGGIVFDACGGGVIGFDAAEQLGREISFEGDATLRANGNVDALRTLVDISSGKTAIFDTNGHDVTFSGGLSGDGGTLQKSGEGTLYVDGDHSGYAGDLVAGKGNVLLKNAGAKLGGKLVIEDGAVFGGVGAHTGPEILAKAGATVRVGLESVTAGNTVALDVANLHLEEDATLAGNGILSGAVHINGAVNVAVAAGHTLFLGAQTSGPGSIMHTGQGCLAVQGGVNVNAFEIRTGTVFVEKDMSITASRSFDIFPEGALAGRGLVRTVAFTNRGTMRIGSSAGLPVQSTFVIDGGYLAAGGSLILGVGADANSGVAMDVLRITGRASRANDGSPTRVLFAAQAPYFPAGTILPDNIIVSEQGGAQTAFDTSEAIVEVGAEKYSYYFTDGGRAGTWGQTGVIDEIPAVAGINASSLLIGKAAFDALGSRLMMLRNNEPSHRFNLWSDGAYRQDKIVTGLYDGARSDTRGVQIGGDMSRRTEGGGLVTWGVFYDYTSSDMEQPGGVAGTRTESNGFGFYAASKNGPWYLNGLARQSFEKYRVSVPGKPSFDIDGTSWAGSLETGYIFYDKAEWNMEPQLQFTYQSHSTDEFRDAFKRVYRIKDASSFETRAGVRLWKEIIWPRGMKMLPHLRASYAWEMLGRSTMTVENKSYECDLNGLTGIIDAGASLQLSHRFRLSAEGAWYYGDQVEGFAINLGGNYTW